MLSIRPWLLQKARREAREAEAREAEAGSEEAATTKKEKGFPIVPFEKAFLREKAGQKSSADQ